ncbi:hypothetical protein PHYC_03935 [Phycisphaerales bacterium]|nr:hypothetical protein PHYC_03935 [Phycisphaerales bacterium]
MENSPEVKREHWLLAAWPGMGNVAVLGAGHLINQLELQPVKELSGRGYFEIGGVGVHEGVIVPPRLPRSVFFTREEPVGNVDLTVFLGESQPTSNSLGFAHDLLDEAAEMEIDRVITFASMATQLHPSQNPSVHGLATEKSLLESLEKLEVRPLADGEIGGMNGVLLGACAQRRMPGLCLLGEIPYFAAGVPNPKAAKAVLESLAMLTGTEIDVNELVRHAEVVDQALIRMLEHSKKEERPAPIADVDVPAAAAGEEGGAKAPKGLDLAARKRIELLFDEAKKDRARAVDLKRELDRLGVFEKYEDRFLDLFRRAE